MNVPHLHTEIFKSVSVSVSFCLCSVSLFLSPSLSLTLSLSMYYLTLSLCLSVSLSFCLCHSLCSLLSLSISLSLSLSLSFSLFLSFLLTLKRWHFLRFEHIIQQRFLTAWNVITPSKFLTIPKKIATKRNRSTSKLITNTPLDWPTSGLALLWIGPSLDWPSCS